MSDSTQTPNANAAEPNSTNGFGLAVKLSALRLNRPRYARVNGVHVTVALIENQTKGQPNEVVAFSSICPHQMGDLSGGGLEDGGIDCPIHFYRFDVRTGACLYPRGEEMKLKIYEVRVDGDDVLVQVDKPKWL